MFGLHTSRATGPVASSGDPDQAPSGPPDLRGFRQAVSNAAMQALRTGEALSFALLRIDNLAVVARAGGREEADRTMAGYARRLAVSFRADDVLTRWSEDCFAILLPRTTVEGAVRALEKARWVLQSDSTQVPHPLLRPRLSAAALPIELAAPFNDTLALAESLLARATEGGPDRICWPGGELAPGLRRVLLATSDPAADGAVEAVLSRGNGHAVHRVPLAAAVAHVAATLPSLVLLDLDGDPERALELLRSLRETSAGAGIPIIVLGSDHALLPIGFAVGADDFVLKPLWPEELRARADRLLLRRARLAPPVASSNIPASHAS